MGTLTKKLHILKTGGREETCDIYTTPEEVGGSPYLAIGVDGTKGYVKLGNTTGSAVTHLRVGKNGITYAAWKKALAEKAIVDVPTGTVSIELTGKFTVPTGVTVIKVSHIDLGVAYVGVTPGTEHSLRFVWIERDPGDYNMYITCDSHDKRYLDDVITLEYPDQDICAVFDVDWSPEINTHKPDFTDY